VERIKSKTKKEREKKEEREGKGRGGVRLRKWGSERVIKKKREHWRKSESVCVNVYDVSDSE